MTTTTAVSITVTVKSGFESGGSLLEWSNGGFQLVARARANTYWDDGDTSFSREVPAGFKGAVTKWSRGCGISTELIGFSQEELVEPSPVAGWAVVNGQHTQECVRLSDRAEWLRAVAAGDQILTDGELVAGGKAHPVTGEVLVTLPYCWGDQAAECYAVYSPNGELIGGDKGCGDRTPTVVDGVAGWEFSSQAEERMRALAEEDARFDLARDRGNGHPDAAHIRGCYRRGMNPLPSCRKAHGGTWKWYASCPSGDTVSGVTIITEHVTPRTEEPYGYGWVVVYTPAK